MISTVKMIRNYQRSGGGGTVDLVPIYNSLNAIQNEINSLITVTKLTTLTSISAELTGIDELSSSVTNLNASVTALSTALTSISAELTGIDELSSSVTNLNASVTALSTAFTSHTSYSDYRFRTFESGVKSSINSLSSSIMNINSIISTLSTATGGGGVKTLTNPTESGYLFTDAVLYSGPDIDAPYGQTFNNAYNTYMQGVTWRDYPSTVTSVPDRTMPAYFGGCVVYGVLSYDNVYAYNLLSCTAQTVVVNNCNSGAIEDGSYSNISFNDVSLASAVGTINTISASDVNVALFSKATCDSIMLSKCNSAIISSVYANHLYIPYCSMISMDRCRVKDISIDYPSTVTSYNSDYVVTLESNTIDKINASLLRCTVNNNDIWTANLYMDYDLMQSSMFTSAGYFNGNTINELSIFNNDNGTGNTTNYAIAKNGIYFGDNSLRHVWYDLYSPLSVLSNNIETLENTLGASLYARSNSVQEWDCEVGPYSALLHNATSTKNIMAVQYNTINRLSMRHGLIDGRLFSISSSPAVTAGLNKLSLNLDTNTINYATFNVLNPLLVGFNGYAESIDICAANVVQIPKIYSVMTLNVINNETFTSSGARSISFEGPGPCHYMGFTNVFPIFAFRCTVDSLNMYIDKSMQEYWSLYRVSATSVNIKMFPTTYRIGLWRAIECSISYLNCSQTDGMNLNVSGNSFDKCTVVGGTVAFNSLSYSHIHLNVNSAYIDRASIQCLDGTCVDCLLRNNAITVGGFFYGTSGGSGNTFVRLNTGL